MRLDRRLTAMAASHYMERANQQSPGQFAYSTPGATELFGKAVLAVYQDKGKEGIPWSSIALEGARDITYKPLQDTILALLQTADPSVVAIAARALSNPNELSLPASRAALEPLLRVLRMYAGGDRDKDADALASFLARVNWDFDAVSEAEEAAFYRLLLNLGGGDRAADRERTPLLGKPAPAAGAVLDEGSYAPLVAESSARTAHYSARRRSAISPQTRGFGSIQQNGCSHFARVLRPPRKPCRARSKQRR